MRATATTVLLPICPPYHPHNSLYEVCKQDQKEIRISEMLSCYLFCPALLHVRPPFFFLLKYFKSYRARIFSSLPDLGARKEKKIVRVPPSVVRPLFFSTTTVWVVCSMLQSGQANNTHGLCYPNENDEPPLKGGAGRFLWDATLATLPIVHKPQPS